ncbi:MAG: class B sortase [Lachnospiraceae bacterium]|nr:class B sortase [Lachnospiraceae bacterium]
MNKKDDFEITDLDKENGYDDYDLSEDEYGRDGKETDGQAAQSAMQDAEDRKQSINRGAKGKAQSAAAKTENTAENAENTVENTGNVAGKKKNTVLANILIALAAICIVAAAAILVIGAMEDRQAKESIKNEQPGALTDNTEPTLTVQTEPEETKDAPGETGTEPEETKDASGETDTEPEETKDVPEETKDSEGEIKDPAQNADTSLVPNPYAEFFLKNEDMAAWLVVPGTNMDYPVMQTPADENYYLYLDFDKKKNKNGSLILDTDSSLDPIGTNLIIHGHNMKSGAMFGNLQEYEDKDYYEDHKTMILYTEECQRNYEVIAVFYTQVYKKTDDVFKFYKFFQADTEEEFLDYYDNIKAMSLYDTGVTAEFGDRFLTLSTCSYQVENGRFVVVAKEVEPGDYYEEIDR